MCTPSQNKVRIIHSFKLQSPFQAFVRVRGSVDGRGSGGGPQGLGDQSGHRAGGPPPPHGLRHPRQGPELSTYPKPQPVRTRNNRGDHKRYDTMASLKLMTSLCIRGEFLAVVQFTSPTKVLSISTRRTYSSRHEMNTQTWMQPHATSFNNAFARARKHA